MTIDIVEHASATQGLCIAEGAVRRGSFALGPVNLGLRPGQVVALVGANGAGKTTLLSLITGQLQMDSGALEFRGVPQEPQSALWRRTIGYVPDDPQELLEELTAEEFWRFTARMHLRGHRGPQADQAWTRMLNRSRELADLLELHPRPRALIGSFSLGMRRKTQLVNALMTDPQLVIMDEPRNGLDPVGIARLHEIIDSLRASRKIVIVASHDVEWALVHADRVVGLRGGTIAFDSADAVTKLSPRILLEYLG